VAAESGVDAVDPGDDVADPGGDRLAGSFALVAQEAGTAGQSCGGGQLVQEGVAFGAGAGGAFRVGPVLGLGDLLGEVVEAGSDLLPGGRVQHVVRAEAKAGQGLTVCVGGGDEVGCAYWLAGAAEQDGEVAQEAGEGVGEPLTEQE
jgi:hypothetical protein